VFALSTLFSRNLQVRAEIGALATFNIPPGCRREFHKTRAWRRDSTEVDSTLFPGLHPEKVAPAGQLNENTTIDNKFSMGPGKGRIASERPDRRAWESAYRQLGTERPDPGEDGCGRLPQRLLLCPAVQACRRGFHRTSTSSPAASSVQKSACKQGRTCPWRSWPRAGFSDQSQLSRHFNRLVGITPGQFRISARIAENGQAPPKKRRIDRLSRGVRPVPLSPPGFSARPATKKAGCRDTRSRPTANGCQLSDSLSMSRMISLPHRRD
jgi:hypothetical protein